MSEPSIEPAVIAVLQPAAAAAVQQRWPEWQAALAAEEPRIVTVQDSQGARPRPLRLLALATDRGVDATYQQEWLELCIAEDGQFYLVTCYKQDLDIAAQWSPGVTFPATFWPAVPAWLVAILAS